VTDQTVHVAVLETRHGVTVLANATDDGLCQSFYQWLTDNWTDDDPVPATLDEAIAVFFADFAGNSYWVDTVTVNP